MKVVVLKNTPRSLCSSQNSTWREDVNCEIAQCSKGCCVLSNECSFVTQTQCKKAATQYGVNMTFKEELKTEKNVLINVVQKKKVVVFILIIHVILEQELLVQKHQIIVL